MYMIKKVMTLIFKNSVPKDARKLMFFNAPTQNKYTIKYEWGK